MNIILRKFQKYNNNIIIKFLYYKIKVIGPLGIVEKNYLNKKNKNIYFLLKTLMNKYQNNFNLNNSIIISDKLLRIFFNDLDKLIIGVNYGWYFGFNITGRGFTFRLKKNNNILYLKLKIGYSHFIYYKIFDNILIKISKKKNKLFFYGLDFWQVSKMANQLRNIRSKHTYKVQGIQFFDEKLKIKPGKKKQGN